MTPLDTRPPGLLLPNKELAARLAVWIKVWPYFEIIALCVLFSCYFYVFSLRTPYHYDSIEYLKGARELISVGHYEQFIPARMVNAWFYVLPVWLFGDGGLRVTNVAMFTALLAAFNFLVRGLYGREVAFWSCLAMATIPATIITVTHLKEDFNSLTMLALAVLCLMKRRSYLWTLVASIFGGVAALTKELPLALFPVFLVAATWVQSRDTTLQSRPEKASMIPMFCRVALGISAMGATMWVLESDHVEYMGRLGALVGLGKPAPFSSSIQRFGFLTWSQSVGWMRILHLALVPAVVVLIRRRRALPLLWLAIGVGSYFLIATNTAVRERHFVWASFFLLPTILGLCFDALRWVSESRYSLALNGSTWALRVFIGILVMLNLTDAYPALSYRAMFNSQQQYFGGLKGELPANALLLGMDNCIIASHYSGLECYTPPANLSTKQCNEFVEKVVAWTESRPVYGLYDLFSYDVATTGGECARAFDTKLRRVAVYTKLHEDFHYMTLGTPIGYFAGLYKDKGCRPKAVKHQSVEIIRGLEMDETTTSFVCPGLPRPVRIKRLAYHGREFELRSQSVVQITRKSQ